MFASYQAHPLPPPTVNVLSARQKAHLRRSSTKITKVLGATPAFVDSLPRSSRSARASAELCHSDIQPSLAVNPPGRKTQNGSRRHSVDSCSQSKPAAHAHRLSLDTTINRPHSSSGVISRGRPEPRLPSPSVRKPKTDSDASSIVSRSSICDSLYEPSFTIPSSTSLRRQKMARVCKLLGDGVPVALVFPEDQAVDVDDNAVGRGQSFLEVRPDSSATLDSLATAVAPESYSHIPRSFDKPLPKRPSFRESAQSVRTLAPIRERLSVASEVHSSSDSDEAPALSQGSSAESLFSTLYTDDECPSPLTPVTPAKDFFSPFAAASYDARRANSKPDERRDISIRLPRRASYLHRRSSSSGSDIVRTRLGSQELEFEIVRGVNDIRL